MSPIRDLLRRSGVSTYALAFRGVSRATVRRWELGQSRPTPGAMARIAEVCGCAYDDVLDAALRTHSQARGAGSRHG